MRHQTGFVTLAVAGIVAAGCSGSSGGGTPSSSPQPQNSTSTSPGSGFQAQLTFDAGTPIASSGVLDTSSAFGSLAVKDGTLQTAVRSVRSGNFQAVNAFFAHDVLGGSEDTFADVTLSVQATRTDSGAADAASYGLICRAQDQGDYYYLGIGSDGFYTIKRVFSTGKNSTDAKDLATGTDATAIHTGANTENDVSASCVGDTLTLSANGTEVAHATDSTYAKGEVGVQTVGTAGVQVSFDNFGLGTR